MLKDNSLQECVDRARETIRKNGGQKALSKKSRAFVTASVAGHCWEFEANPGSYGTTESSDRNPYSHLSEQDKKFYIKRLPRWNSISELEKVFLAHEYICTAPDLIPISFTFNVGNLTEKTILRSNKLNYPRDATTKAFKIVFGIHKVLFWMVEETEPRRHFHGVIGVPKDIATPETYEALARALENSPLVRKRVENNRNKKAYVSATYKAKGEDNKKTLKPVDSGAVMYATKKWTNNNQLRSSISSGLRKQTGDNLSKTITLLKGTTTD